MPPANDGAANNPPYRSGGAYDEGDNYRRYEDERSAAAPQDEGAPGYGEPYHAPGEYRDGPPPRDDGYSQNEIIEAGGRFFGSVSKGLASVVEYAFQKSGRPNGYILGSDAGGAFVAGLRYGEGTLYTRDAGSHRVFWQGPSIGYDFGGEGSKTMVLVYNLRDPSQIYERYRGRTGLRLPCWRRRYPVPDAWQRDTGAHPVGDRPATRCERRIFEVYPLSNVESILSRRAAFA